MSVEELPPSPPKGRDQQTEAAKSDIDGKKTEA